MDGLQPITGESHEKNLKRMLCNRKKEMKLLKVCILIIFSFAAPIRCLQVGVGIHDVTGPVGGVNFMGYAMPEQITHGIHMRLFARAYVFHDVKSKKRVVFCSCDLAMLSPNVKNGVIKALQDAYGSHLYTHQNVLLSATHTHSAPGGYHDYLLYSITSMGYVDEAAKDMIYGIVGAIKRAHDNLRTRMLKFVQGRLENANINRSPTSYLLNPKSEREKYATDGNTDKTMSLLAIKEPGKKSLAGLITWFSVHCTSMNSSNERVSGDNKGYASYLMEHEMNSNRISGGSGGEYFPYLKDEYHRLAESGELFVAAFAQTNEGDVSPNIQGEFCINTGQPCDSVHSTCKDSKGRIRNEFCIARGPGFETGGDQESTRIIGVRQYMKARELVQEAMKKSESGSDWDTVAVEHAWISMGNQEVRLMNGSIAHTCKPARGFSFAAGTTDGPGAFDFIQGDNSTGNPFWNIVKSFIKKPTKEQSKCHHPKPILLDTGEINLPYPWEPQVVDIQLMRVGNLFILAVPAEFTTMAGRRLRAAVQETLRTIGSWPVNDGAVVIAGLSNSYSGYVTTFEEYQAQRYEAASTIYGPHTLQAYIQEFQRLALRMFGKEKEGKRLFGLPPSAHPPTESPKDFSNRLLSLLPPVISDAVPPFKKFGQVVSGKDIRNDRIYNVGDQVHVTFYSGHPRSLAQMPGRQLENWFMAVEKYIGPNLSDIDFRSVVENVLFNGGGGSRLVLQDSSERRGESEVQMAFHNWLLSGQSSNSGSSRLLVTPRVSYTDIVFEVTRGLRTYQEESNAAANADAVFTFLVNPHSLVPSLSASKTTNNHLWKMVRDDSDWDTEFEWSKGFGAVSYAKCKWNITVRPDKIQIPALSTSSLLDLVCELPPVYIKSEGDDNMSGSYRLAYKGVNKNVIGKVSFHEGFSSVFTVKNGSQLKLETFEFQI